jgi:hypothetical protein
MALLFMMIDGSMLVSASPVVGERQINLIIIPRLVGVRLQ